MSDFSLSVFDFPVLHVVKSLSHAHLILPHDVCYSCDQAAQYHKLGPSKLKGYMSDPTLGWLQSEEVWLRCMGSSCSRIHPRNTPKPNGRIS
jgi:hypothetical protein